MIRDPFGPWSGARRLLWVLLTLLCCFLFAPRLFSVLYPPRYELLDFYQEWSSAKNVVQGLPVYSPLEVTVPRYLGLQKRPGTEWYWDVNVHPPTSVLLALPLQALPYRSAFLVWNLVSLAALCVSGGLILRGLKVNFSVWCLLPLVCLALIADPLYQQVLQGQLNLVLLLLIVGIWVADRNDRPYLAGTLLAAATAIKLFPGFLVLYFLLQRNWKAVAATAVGFGVLTALTTAILGTEAMTTYVTEILPTAATWKGAWNNASLTGFWHKLFAPGTRNGQLTPLWNSPLLATALTGLSTGLILLLTAPLLWRAATRRQRDHAFGLTVAAMLLVSPVTWEHYFLVLLLPLALVWSDLPRGSLARRLLWPVVIALCLPVIMLCNIFIPGGFFRGEAGVGHALTLMSYQFYALLGLFSLSWLATRGQFQTSAPAADPLPQPAAATASLQESANVS